MAERYENDQLPDGEAGEDQAPAAKSSKAWLKIIDDAERVLETYQAKCDSIDKLYADLERLANVARDREMQLFWANVCVLGPSVYSRPPVPVVVPRFKDRRPVPRLASELLERTTIVSFDTQDIDQLMRLVRDDLTISGRGVPWVRYEAKGSGKDFKESVCVEHKDRRDFVHDMQRKWGDVDWVAGKSWMTRGEMRSRFKKTSGDAYKSATYAKRKDAEDADDGRLKAGVWELWCKSQNKVVWVADGCEVLLDQGEPHLKLEGFFPCPRPAFGTLQRRTLIPVPDFLFYKDQIEEINELTARIGALCDALKVKGFYPSGAGDLSDAIEAAVKEATDNQLLVPVSNWAMVGNGGVKDMIVWLPIDQVAAVLKEVIALRKELMDDVYQITGLSDIMRGETDASETATAQQLKSNYGSVRIRDRRDEMVRIARDIVRIAAEIMAENFQPQTMLDMSQLEIPTNAQVAQQIQPLAMQAQRLERELADAGRDPETQRLAQQNPQQAQQIIGQAKQQLQGLQGQIEKIKQTVTLEQVLGLLREQRIRPFVLDIETDSTIAPDENAQKQRATEFVTAIGGFMKEALPLVQTVPQAAGMAAETLKFMASQFRAGRPLEQAIDDFADQLAQMASQPKPPSPDQVKAQADAAKTQADAQAKQLKAKTDAETAAAKNQERQAGAQKIAAEAEARLLEARAKAADADQDRHIRAREAEQAAADRQADRAGKLAVNDKQLQLMDAKRLDEAAAHAQAMEKGALELELLGAKIEQAKNPPKPAAQPGAN
nr:hypothetical protein [uncultured Bradyrhizobium sp.]